MYVVVGTPGSGKTTVINEFVKKHSEFNVYNYGTLMFEKARELFGISHRDEMRKLDIEKQKEIQYKVAEFLKGMGRRTILDTHASIKTPKGYYPGLPFSILEILDVDGFVFITAKAEEILERRMKDKSRIRDIESLDEIELHNRVNLAFLASYSFFKSVPLKIIFNNNGELDKAVEELEKALL